MIVEFVSVHGNFVDSSKNDCVVDFCVVVVVVDARTISKFILELCGFFVVCGEFSNTTRRKQIGFESTAGIVVEIDT